MKKKIFASALISLLFLQSYSQSSFRKGYLIMKNNDTISGFIRSRGKIDNSNKCVFSVDGRSVKTTYYPDDIKAYRFTGGKYFISREILNDSDTVRLFLEYLFDGISDLYYYYDSSGDHYLIEKDNSLKELRNDIKTITITDDQPGVSPNYSNRSPVNYEKESKEYIGVLKNLFVDGPNTMKRVESISLSQNSLVKIAQDYHYEVCPGMICTNYTKNNTKIEFSIGPIAGVSFSRISYKEAGAPFFLGNLPEGTSTGASLGAFINIHDPTISEKLSIQLEMSLYKAKFSTEISYLNLTTLKIPFILKYTFPSDRIKPSALLGLAYNRILTFDNYANNYGNFNFISGKSQYSLIAAIETAYKFNEKKGIFLQLRYEYCYGQQHVGEWGNTPGGFNSFLSSINLMTGIMF